MGCTPSEVTMPGRHEFEGETSELRVRVEAPTRRELFEQAGRALAEAMVGGPEELAALPPPHGPIEEVAVEGRDHEALLVGWLNELIFLRETSGRVFTDLRIKELSGGRLSALIRGAEAPEGRTFVKAATYHGLTITDGPQGAAATVVLDV